MNQIFIIHPYFYNGSWVFDDAEVGLRREPFVSGIPEIIENLVADIADAQKGFRLLFSAEPFPEHELKLKRLREEIGGYWYQAEDLNSEGWLCPAMFKYFDLPPEEIYIKIDRSYSQTQHQSSKTIEITREQFMAFDQELEQGNLIAMRKMLDEIASQFDC